MTPDKAWDLWHQSWPKPPADLNWDDPNPSPADIEQINNYYEQLNEHERREPKWR